MSFAKRSIEPRALRQTVLAFLVLLVTLFHARLAHAHKPSDAYLSLTVGAIAGRSVGAIAGRSGGASLVHVRWDVALRDLADATELDADENGEVTWLEVRSHAPAIAAKLVPELHLAADGAACEPKAPDGAFEPKIARHTDGAYLVWEGDYVCASAPAKLSVNYTLFFARDPQHRGVVKVVGPSATHTFVLSKDDHVRDVVLDESGASLRAFASMVKTGLAHIAEGTDHLAFLFALLFPAVLVRKEKTWEPAPAWRPVVLDVLRVVTAFTLAHSLTLTLSALGLVRLPSRLVESVIAASVVLAASNNVRPWLRDGRWTMAFALGLMHGFGFSATLEDLELSRGTFAASLLGFNVGVELGQLAVVLVFLPLAFAARKTAAYRKGVLFGGSLVILVIAVVWLVERALAVRIFPV